MASNLYHSALCAMGQVTVTVKSERTKSKFQDKPDYYTLTIAGQDYWYPLDSEACGQFLAGQKGNTFVIQASGRDQDAALTYIGPAAAPPQQAAPPAPPQPPAGYPPGPAAAAPPPATHQPPRPAQPARPSQQRPPQPPPQTNKGVYGATAGAAVKDATGIVERCGFDPFTSEFYEHVHFIASNIVRVAEMVERRELAVTPKQLTPPQQ